MIELGFEVIKEEAAGADGHEAEEIIDEEDGNHHVDVGENAAIFEQEMLEKDQEKACDAQ